MLWWLYYTVSENDGITQHFGGDGITPSVKIVVLLKTAVMMVLHHQWRWWYHSTLLWFWYYTISEDGGITQHCGSDGITPSVKMVVIINTVVILVLHHQWRWWYYSTLCLFWYYTISDDCGITQHCGGDGITPSVKMVVLLNTLVMMVLHHQ